MCLSIDKMCCRVYSKMPINQLYDFSSTLYFSIGAKNGTLFGET